MFRIMTQIEMLMAKLRESGFDEHMLDELKRLYGRNRMYIIFLEYTFGILHTIFASLAFKNDIGFYAKTRNTRGLSTRAVTGRLIAQVRTELGSCLPLIALPCCSNMSRALHRFSYGKKSSVVQELVRLGKPG